MLLAVERNALGKWVDFTQMRYVVGEGALFLEVSGKLSKPLHDDNELGPDSHRGHSALQPETCNRDHDEQNSRDDGEYFHARIRYLNMEAESRRYDRLSFFSFPA